MIDNLFASTPPDSSPHIDKINGQEELYQQSYSCLSYG